MRSRLIVLSSTALIMKGVLLYHFRQVAGAGVASLGDMIMLAVAIYLDICRLFTVLQGLSGTSRDQDDGRMTP